MKYYPLSLHVFIVLFISASSCQPTAMKKETFESTLTASLNKKLVVISFLICSATTKKLFM